MTVQQGQARQGPRRAFVIGLMRFVVTQAGCYSDPHKMP
jgi:hypothetical protein